MIYFKNTGGKKKISCLFKKPLNAICLNENVCPFLSISRGALKWCPAWEANVTYGVSQKSQIPDISVLKLFPSYPTWKVRIRACFSWNAVSRGCSRVMNTAWFLPCADFLCVAICRALSVVAVGSCVPFRWQEESSALLWDCWLCSVQLISASLILQNLSRGTACLGRVFLSPFHAFWRGSKGVYRGTWMQDTMLSVSLLCASTSLAVKWEIYLLDRTLEEFNLWLFTRAEAAVEMEFFWVFS